jgi:CheY-like chemotaxis protein
MAMQLLVVDDEQDVCSLFQQRFRKELRSQKLSFAFANSGAEALAYLHQHTSEPITVLSDINMPGMSGLELLMHIRQDFDTLKPEVLMITAYGDSERYNQAISLGASDLLTKPLDINLLRQKIHLQDYGCFILQDKKLTHRIPYWHSSTKPLSHLIILLNWGQ